MMKKEVQPQRAVVGWEVETRGKRAENGSMGRGRGGQTGTCYKF